MSQIRHFNSLTLLTVGYKDEPSTSTISCETISFGWTKTSSQFKKYSQVLLRDGLLLASGLLLQRFRNVMTLSSTAWPCIYYFSGVPSPVAINELLYAGSTIKLSPIISDKSRLLIILLDLLDIRSYPCRSRMPGRTPPFTRHPAPNGWSHSIDNKSHKE